MKANYYSHFHQYRIQESLKDLKQSLTKLNTPLLMYYGEVNQALDIIRDYYDIDHIYAHEETGNHLTYMRDLDTITYCKDHHITFTEYPCNAVVRKLSSRDHRSIFQKDRMAQALIPIPDIQDPFTISAILAQKSKNSFKSFVAVSRPSTWIYSRDQPGETSAQVRLQYFLTHASGYRYALSRPELSVKDSSRLSAYLSFGNLSMKQVHQATLDRIRLLKTQSNEDKNTKEVSSLVAFYQRLFWRCHFIQKLESRPKLEFYNQNKVFDTIRIETNKVIIDARYYGQTGIPLIDAGMRCLHATGWINFRMRATLVSFICNTCMQPWQAIGPMLAKIFVDYEPGIHYSQLQMQSGTTGINTIRIYNPIKQLADKDSDLKFVRKWLPELQNMDSEDIKSL
jgi:deoxyribodipyrimidine photo-lyase